MADGGRILELYSYNFATENDI